MTDEHIDPPPRWLWYVFALAVVTVVVGVGVFIIATSLRSNSLASEARDLTRAVRSAQLSSECRAQYESARHGVIEHATALALTSNIHFAGFLLGDPMSGVAVLAQDKENLEKANQAVIDLPSLEEMMRSGYQFAGEPRHPPCPTAGKVDTGD